MNPKFSLRAITLERIILLVFSGIFCALTTHYIFVFGFFPFDDAFIHMRIARNLAEHGLPYFNPSERVMGDSSLLWISVVAFTFKLFGSGPQVLIWLAAALVLGCYAVAVLILSRDHRPWVSALMASVIITLFLTTPSAGLMEPPLISLMMLAAVYCLQRERSVAFGFFSAMCFITRFEYAVWLVLAFCFAKDRRAFLVGTILPLLYFTVFNFYFFGTLIPQTVRAKSVVFRMGYDHFLRNFAFLGLAGVRYGASIALLAVVLGWQGWLAVTGKMQRWVALPMLFSIALSCLYLAGHTFMFPWYWANLIVPMTFAALASRAKGKWVLVLILFLCSLPRIKRTAIDWGSLFTGNFVAQSNVSANLHVLQYIAIAKELSLAYPSATLLTSEIGGLGWGFQGKVLDGVGLISPEVMKYHPMKVPEERSDPGIGAIPSGVVRDMQPELVVSMMMFSEDFRRKFNAGEFKNYRLLQKIPLSRPEGSIPYDEHSDPNQRFIEVYARTGPRAP